MKLLFVHDHPFYLDNNNVYSGGGLPSEIWNNYLMNFTKITVFGRRSNAEKDRKVISSYQDVSFHLTENYRSPLQLAKNYLKLHQELKEEISAANVVLVRLPSVLGFIAGRIAKKLAKPLWVEQVGNAREAFSGFGTFLGSAVAPLFQKINKKLAKEADFVSYVTERQLQTIYPKGAHAIATSLSNVKIMNSLTEEQLNKKRFNNTILDVALIGGFDVKYKGQDVLLKAISLLPQDIRNYIRVHLIGKGDSDWLMQVAEILGVDENIVFRGALTSGDEVSQYLSKISLYVQPSLTEGLPRATVEAMAAGCPVIGSDAGGIIELVSNKFVHDAGNSQKLMEHILLLYNDREMLLNEAKRSLRCAQRYIYSSLMKKREDFYKEMNEALARK